jgi:hypothetical protein
MKEVKASNQGARVDEATKKRNVCMLRGPRGISGPVRMGPL